jgi:lysophospholipase L1-like esterase
VTRVPAAEYVENIRAMARLARAQSAKVLVIAPIFRDPKTEPREAERIGRHREALRQAMLADATPYLELVELTEAGWPANDPLFGERIHPSWLGHRLLAERLASTLRAEHMLGDLQAPVPLPLT